jgi:hypothetical protein
MEPGADFGPTISPADLDGSRRGELFGKMLDIVEPDFNMQ